MCCSSVVSYLWKYELCDAVMLRVLIVDELFGVAVALGNELTGVRSFCKCYVRLHDGTEDVTCGGGKSALSFQYFVKWRSFSCACRSVSCCFSCFLTGVCL